jgi:hypothetical protein
MTMYDLNTHRAPVRTLARTHRTLRSAGPSSLVDVAGFAFAVKASRSALPAALRIARRASHACEFLRDVLGAAPRLVLRVLDVADWRAHADVAPYGVSHVGADGTLVVGARPAEAWQAVSGYLGRHLPSRQLARLTAAHGVDPVNGRGPALAPFTELLVVHEVAHVLATQRDIRFDTRWLADAFANYVLVATLGDREPAALRLVGSLAEAAATLDGHLPTLSEFERDQLDVVENVLAELAITRGVYAAYALQHTKPLARLFASFGPNRRQRDADYELGRMLAIDVHPTLAAIPARFVRANMRAAA